ncbi:MAG: M24 family metallopeptidase [Gemmatimonadetes bacterium]|nr:M24 family metallopeptidase [Gemmatimonadota bacterium]NIO32354.1 M24 family metallopeptidase [Gemmatimonadota bacterium]
MRRRDFVRLAGTAGAAAVFPRLERAGQATTLSGPTLGQRIGQLPDATFQTRLVRAAELAAQGGLSALFCEPSTNFAYLAGGNFGRSERLIALIVPTAELDPFFVAPQFEVERVARTIRPVGEVRGWREEHDPFSLIADALAGLRPARIGIEPSTRYGMARRLNGALPDWELADATSIFERMRIIKSETEIDFIRRAVSITETSIAATFASLDVGVTDREVARYLSGQMRERGASGGGLVQFGPTSALPHGGTEGRRLEYGMPVLIDAGCRVQGYTSDITRMHFFGEEPGPEYREVFNTVFSAQTAAFDAARPGMEFQQLDRIARQVIREAGYGEYFTHRLGHGMGMDGHEAPYVVEGNTRALEPGMVFTIEPGIYLPGRWGVRIEDDVVVRESGLEALSTRVALI